MHIPVNTIFFILMIAGIIALQIFLSRQPRQWPGLVLPGIFALLSLIYLLNIAVPADGLTADLLFQMLVVFVYANVPTVALTSIWFACRSKTSRNTPIDKMNIQDLD